MDTKRANFWKINLLGALIIFSVFLPGCILDDESEEGDFTIVDDLGNSVTIKKYPETIASLSPSATEILYALNLGDNIVSIDSASNYPEGASDHEVVFTYTGLNEEKFVASDPDIVFLNHNLDLSEEGRTAIEEYGYKVIILNPVVIEDVLDNIELIGKVTDRTDEAKTLMDTMETKIDEIEAKGLELAKNSTTKILYVVYYDGSGDPWVAGEDTYVDDIINKAGGQNIITGFEGFIQVSLETIVSEKPDIIICSQNEAFPTVTRTTIINDPVLNSLDAVESGNIFDVNADIVERPGPRIVQGLEFFQNKIIEK